MEQEVPAYCIEDEPSSPSKKTNTSSDDDVKVTITKGTVTIDKVTSVIHASTMREAIEKYEKHNAPRIWLHDTLSGEREDVQLGIERSSRGHQLVRLERVRKDSVIK